MAKHKPTLIDAASDLWRCVYLSESGFESSEFLHFYTLAKHVFLSQKVLLGAKKEQSIASQLKKAENTLLSKEKRREHLLTAAILLQ